MARLKRLSCNGERSVHVYAGQRRSGGAGGGASTAFDSRAVVRTPAGKYGRQRSDPLEIATNKDQNRDFYNTSVIDTAFLWSWDRLCTDRGGSDAYHLPDDDRPKHVVSACRGANHEVTLFLSIETAKQSSFLIPIHLELRIHKFAKHAIKHLQYL